jgi:hypothetical protein
MQRSNNLSKSVKTNFFINLLNFIPFLIVIITGLILQVGYHMHHLPDGYVVSCLNKSGWSILHKISASISLAGLITHFMLHWNFISVISDKILRKKSIATATLSYWLFIISVPTCLIAMTSWIFLNHGDIARHILVEIHDKLALLLIILFIMHIISRAGWIIKTYRKLL